jgi:predicted DNA-binding protein (UPF0251 family)
MSRPFKWRKVENIPSVAYFLPQKENFGDVAENVIKLEELEAIRLKDLLGLEQEECAEKMEVSRPTFQRILISAREKIADSLCGGKAIRIEGGNYTKNICTLKCRRCGSVWKDTYENVQSQKDGKICLKCGSDNVICGHNCWGGNCGKRGNCL